MAHRSIEILIGRLVTDEAFRSAFRRNASATLTGFIESGFELTAVEMSAVRTTPGDAWDEIAGHVDARLQKVALPPAGGQS